LGTFKVTLEKCPTFLYKYNMIKRELEKTLKKLIKKYPIVTLMGPRQSGKTTLAKSCFPKKPYCSLEDIDTRQFAEQDPRGFLARYPNGAILDEIQQAPFLLSYIQTIVDNDKRKGLFILTGSHQLQLSQGVSQSLAGRTALLTLLPLTLAELFKSSFNDEIDEQLVKGFYPGVYDNDLEPVVAYRSYLQTYIERDLRQLINIKDLSTFQRFLKLCAGRIGQILNKHSLANEVGVSSTTIESWISMLEASHIIIRLQPYFENLGKRIVKSPKLYFTDTGLASYLLDIHDARQMNRDPLRGNLIENLVFLELVKHSFNQGLDHQLYYFRDQHQNEVDFIHKSGSSLVPIEVKSAKTFHPEFLRGIEFFASIAKKKFSKGFVVYTGEHEQNIKNIKVLNYKNISKIYYNYSR